MMPLQGVEGGKNGVDHFDINSTVLNAYASETSSTSKASSSTRCSNPTDLNANSREEQLESTRAEMGEVREENERLKTLLATIMEDYRSLQSRILNVTQQTTDRSLGGAGDGRDVEEQPDHDHLVSLRLGTTSTTTTDQTKNSSDIKQIVDDDRHQGLSLGLQPTSTASDHSQKRLLRQNQTAPKRPDDPDEASRQIHGKKARVSVRARCDTPTMMDGCQWRKYGQKISKGNPCPRAYYRCTVAPACPVRKQVQRCSDDMSILITTYEGTHNHPLPMGATAMASTTSAAATMLMSGSSNSGHPGVEVPIAMPMTCSTTNSALLNGLNFSSGLRQYYQPPNPTITLDLTSPTTDTPHLNTLLSQTAPRYSSTNFNFSPMGHPNTSLQHSNTPWSNSSGLNNVMNIGNQIQQRTAPPSFLQKPAGQSSDQKNSSSSGSGNLTYTIAKAITTDPSFQSSIKDAINSFVSNGNRKEVGGGHVGSFFSRIDGSSGGGSVANQHQANQMLLQSSLELSAPKASSSSPVDQAREHIMKN